jgi:hypothetical protein
MNNHDAEYAQILINLIAMCRNYRPQFGHGTGLTLTEFQTLYQSDPFYAWFGLDSPLMYAAHKAAGGMTSVYRQIGIGCQRLVQRILMDTLDLSTEQSAWSYQIQRRGRKPQTLSLDGRIPIADVKAARRSVLKRWLRESCQELGVSAQISRVLQGAVFIAFHTNRRRFS